MTVLDLFAGARGWDVAARRLGLDVDAVELWDVANRTAVEAGFGDPVCLDVRHFHTEPGRYDIHLGSPSCRRYAASGNGAGRLALDQIVAAVRLYGLFGYAEVAGLDDDATLTLEPLRVALEGEPRAIGWEQVPSVLPIWQACAEVLRGRGYAVWTGVVSAEQFGVPQVRKRAVLLARRDRAVMGPPPTTHSRFYPRDPDRRDPGVKPWVSMAEALGWGMTRRPSMTVTGGGSYTGGAEPFGHAAREGMARQMAAGHWDLGAAASGSMRVDTREAAILQTFPSGYPFHGNQGQRFQQIGNAVPTELAEALIREIL